jgi:hypothetical protein
VRSLRVGSALAAAVVAIALAPLAAFADQAGGVYASPTPASTVEPAPTPTRTLLRVLQAPTEIGTAELRVLVNELAVAGDSWPVIVRVPASATFDVDPEDGILTSLRDAARDGELVIVRQPGAIDPDGAAALLGAFSDRTFHQAGVELSKDRGGDLWAKVKELTGCEDCTDSVSADAAPHTLGLDDSDLVAEQELGPSLQTAGGALTGGSPDEEGGGIGLGPLALGALLLLVAALALGVVMRGRRDSPEPVPVRREPVPVGGNAQGPRPPIDSAPSARRPPPRPRRPGQPAQVVSVLDPEGYVEIDRCLRRARWGSADASPRPGDWVSVDDHGRTLWAFPATTPLRPTAGRRA